MVTLGASWGSAICNWELLWGDTGEQNLCTRRRQTSPGQLRISVYNRRKQFILLYDPYVGILEKE